MTDRKVNGLLISTAYVIIALIYKARKRHGYHKRRRLADMRNPRPLVRSLASSVTLLPSAFTMPIQEKEKKTDPTWITLEENVSGLFEHIKSAQVNWRHLFVHHHARFLVICQFMAPS